MDLQEEGHHLEHVGKKLCQRHQRGDAVRTRLHPSGAVAETKRRTLDVVLEDLREDGEERVLEAAHGGRVGLTGDADRQTEGLKQVVVKVRLAGVLEDTQKKKDSWVTFAPPSHESAQVFHLADEEELMSELTNQSRDVGDDGVLQQREASHDG